MDKISLQLFCILNLIFFYHAAEYQGGNRQVYNLTDLFTKSFNRLQNSFKLYNESSIPNMNLQFSSIDPKVISESSGNLLLNSKCLGDILFILRNLKSEWTWHLFDSFGKLESGIFQGNLKWVGDYNECIGIHSVNPKSDKFGNFHGKYCSVTWSMSVTYQNLSVPASFTIGICVPDSCSTTEVQDVLKISHMAGNVPVSSNIQQQQVFNASVVCKPNERHLNTPAKAVIALLSVLCSLAVLGSSITMMKYFKNILKETRDLSLIVNVPERDNVSYDSNILAENVESDDELLLRDNISTSKMTVCLGKLQTFLSCFCIFSNGAKLLNTDSSDGQLMCIHGIRFLSMSWIILGHAYGFCVAETKNLLDAVQSLDNFPSQIVLEGFYAVDSFFVLSGFLLAYLTMKEFDKTKGVISWSYFYIHRYIRLTPIYMIVLGFSASVYFYIGSGPYWLAGDFDPVCRDNWWYNLLYINNFRDITEQCMAWSWYLANDMQFFVISPIFLISLWRWPKIGYALLATFLGASCLSNFFLTYHFNLMTGVSDMFNNPGMTDYTEAMAKFFKYFNKLYVKPYARISPYLIGIIVGYLLFKHNKNVKPKYSWITLCIGWIVSTTITLAVVFGLYHNHPTLLAGSFYNALNRTCYALGLSWVIYICLIGQGGIVNDILSLKFFIPLSRLTYAAYLIHPLIINAYYSSLKASFEFSHPTVVITYLGFLIVTYGISLPVSLILEYPVVSLQKLAVKTFSRKG